VRHSDASRVRARRCTGIERGRPLLPLDERGRTVGILLSPRSWRRVARFLSGNTSLSTAGRARLVRRLLLPRRMDERMDVTLPAPIAGFDIGRRGSRGLRLFDLSRGTVALFAYDEDQFVRELRGVQLGSKLGIGPRLIDHDVEDRWLREELLPGLDLRSGNRRLLELQPDAATRLVCDLLVPLWSEEGGRATPTRELADRLLAEIIADLGAPAAESGSSDARLDWAHRLRNELVSLPETASSIVPIVWSHGAVNSKSMLEVDGRLRLVDWENADLRPVTSDAWHLVARWYRRRGPAINETDRSRALGFMETVRSKVLELRPEWRDEIASALEPTAHNLRVWALAALRRRARKDAEEQGTVAESPHAAARSSETDRWLEAFDRMLRIDPNARTRRD
jgi:hypothetical protein